MHTISVVLLFGWKSWTHIEYSP